MEDVANNVEAANLRHYHYLKQVTNADAGGMVNFFYVCKMT